MPAWKLKELEKERERKEKEEHEAAKKNATAEAIQKRQMGMLFLSPSCLSPEFGIDSAFMTLRPGQIPQAGKSVEACLPLVLLGSLAGWD